MAILQHPKALNLFRSFLSRKADGCFKVSA
jgi:hypothetical protein